MTETLRVLVVEDNPADVDLIREALLDTGLVTFDVLSESRLATALLRLDREQVDLVLLDLSLPDSQGLTTLQRLVRSQPDLPVIILTGHEDDTVAVDAVRQGAQDILVKGRFDRNLLSRSIRFAVERQGAARRLVENEMRLRAQFDLASEGILTLSPSGDLLDVNESFARMHGYTRDEMQHMNLRDLDTSGTAALVAERMHRLLAGETQTFLVEHYHKDGHVFPLEVSANRVTAGSASVILCFHRDISGRIQEETLARDRESLLATTLASTIDGILVVDNEGRTILTNPRFAEIWGIPADILETRNDEAMLDFVLEQVVDPDAFKRRVASLYASDDTDMESIHFKDGRIVERYSLPLISGGEHIGRVWSFRDVTTKIRAEQEARASNERFRLLFDRAVDGILILSPDGKVVAVNESFARMHGYAQREMTALTMKDLDTPEAYRHLPEKMTHVLAGGSHTFEVEHLHHDGHVIPLEVTTSLVTVNGEPLIQEFHRDITERRRTTAALRENQSLLATIIDGTTDPVYVKDRDGRYLLFNHAAELVTGRTVAETIGKGDMAFFPPGDARVIMAGDQKVMQEQVVSSYEEMLTAADGRLMTFWSTKGPIFDAAGHVSGLFGISRDITERKAAAARLEALLQDREALIKEVHHRVKNNLQVVSSLLRLESSRSTLPDTRAAFKEMHGRVRSMAMLHEMLYRSGTYASVDLGAYLRRLATEAFRAMAHSPSSVHLRLNLATTRLGMDQASPCGLLVNELLSNSLEHGFPDGRTGEVLVELEAVDGGPRVRLRVSDTGVGLPADFAARRTESLGLQLVADLTRQLGGTLEIGPGPVAVFTVTFTPRPEPALAGAA